jgi:hypothetical protein
MVEDSEIRGGEKPWLHFGVFQGSHWDRIRLEKFRLHLEVQISWPCECHKRKLEAICEDLFRIHAWDPAHAWARSCVLICDGASNLGQVKAWRKLALLIIRSHHKSGRLLECGAGRIGWGYHSIHFLKREVVCKRKLIWRNWQGAIFLHLFCLWKKEKIEKKKSNFKLLGWKGDSTIAQFYFLWKYCAR